MGMNDGWLDLDMTVHKKNVGISQWPCHYGYSTDAVKMYRKNLIYECDW